MEKSSLCFLETSYKVFPLSINKISNIFHLKATCYNDYASNGALKISNIHGPNLKGDSLSYKIWY